MKIYQVGGCVRDRLLGLEPKDIDYVVVGSTPEEMISLGFEQVGEAFPVFLHPETKDEYALARKEIKTGSGYSGFSTETKDVTLEEDLFRRDLTINAIAMDNDGKLIDPYNGADDLKKGILRHVSSHFNEDPVRLLRIARFASRYNFTIAPETNELLKSIVQNGEVDSLQGERVWLELEKTISEKHVEKFFETLTECGACSKIFPFAKFPHPEKFSEENTARDNLLIIFSELDNKQLKKWKMTSQDKELITIYKNYFNEGKAYTDMYPIERFKFLRGTKAFHKIAADPELNRNIFSHIQRFQATSLDVDAQIQAIKDDVENFKNSNIEELSTQFQKENPKSNIIEFIHEKFTEIIEKSPSYQKQMGISTSTKPRF